MDDHYAVLGLDRCASAEEIRVAYRSLARTRHPDAGGSADEMARLNEAHRVLGDPSRRAVYDADLRRFHPLPTDRLVTGQPTLDFGRYAGWTLEAVAATDDDYLAWLVRTPAGLPLRAEISRILADRARALDALRPMAATSKPSAWR